MKVRIEVITAPGCKKCARVPSELRAVAVSVFGEDNFVWREVNVLKELDYAVTLGVLTTPAIAVNGELRFPSLPTAEQFRGVLLNLAQH